MLKEFLFIIISIILTIFMYNKFNILPTAYWYGVLNVIIVLILDKIFHIEIKVDFDDLDNNDF